MFSNNVNCKFKVTEAKSMPLFVLRLHFFLTIIWSTMCCASVGKRLTHSQSAGILLTFSSSSHVDSNQWRESAGASMLKVRTAQHNGSSSLADNVVNYRPRDATGNVSFHWKTACRLELQCMIKVYMVYGQDYGRLRLTPNL